MQKNNKSNQKYTFQKHGEKTVNSITLEYKNRIVLQKDREYRRTILEMLKYMATQVINLLHNRHGKKTYFLENNKNYVFTKNMKAEKFLRKICLTQRRVMNPLLFSIFMNDIAKKSKSRKKQNYFGYKHLKNWYTRLCICRQRGSFRNYRGRFITKGTTLKPTEDTK